MFFFLPPLLWSRQRLKKCCQDLFGGSTNNDHTHLKSTKEGYQDRIYTYIYIYTNCGTCPQKTDTMKLKQHWYSATTVSTLFYSNRCLARWNTGIPKYSIRFFRKIPLCLATKRQGDDVLCEAPYGTETNGGNIAWMVPYHAMVP